MSEISRKALQAEPDWGLAAKLIEAQSMMQARGIITGTSNWGAALAKVGADHFARSLTTAPEQPPPAFTPGTASDGGQEIVWPKSRDVGRMGDITPARQSVLRVGLDSDNDVFVNVWDMGERADGSDFQTASVEFCNGVGGGGQSPRTRAALINLMIAMEADTQAAPHKGWPWLKESNAIPAKGDTT